MKKLLIIIILMAVMLTAASVTLSEDITIIPVDLMFIITFDGSIHDPQRFILYGSYNNATFGGHFTSNDNISLTFGMFF